MNIRRAPVQRSGATGRSSPSDGIELSAISNPTSTPASIDVSAVASSTGAPIQRNELIERVLQPRTHIDVEAVGAKNGIEAGGRVVVTAEPVQEEHVVGALASFAERFLRNLNHLTGPLYPRAGPAIAIS